MPNPDGVWEYNPEEGMIRRRVIAGSDTIGDIRISYYVPKEFIEGDICSVLGKVGPNGDLTELGELSRMIISSISSKKSFITKYFNK